MKSRYLRCKSYHIEWMLILHIIDVCPHLPGWHSHGIEESQFIHSIRKAMIHHWLSGKHCHCEGSPGGQCRNTSN